MTSYFLIPFILSFGSLSLHAEPSEATMQATMQSAEFPRGLFFDINNTGVMPPMEFEYDLSDPEGRNLVVGGTELNDRTFYFAVGPLSKMLSQFPDFAGKEGGQSALILRFPENLLKNGSLEVISRNGNSLWKTEISENDVNKWKNRLAGWQKKLGLNPKIKPLPALFTTQMAVMDWTKMVNNIANSQEWFRFCLTQNEGTSFTRLCSVVTWLSPHLRGLL